MIRRTNDRHFARTKTLLEWMKAIQTNTAQASWSLIIRSSSGKFLNAPLRIYKLGRCRICRNEAQ